MLPFRSGRTGFPGASSALFLVVLLSCAAFAAEKTKPGKAAAKPATPTPAQPKEGLTSVPLPVGRDARGLVLPIFDLLGHIRGRLEAGVAKRLDNENVQFQTVKFTTFTPEETPELEISVTDSIFNLKTQMLSSSERSTVKRADFEIVGDKMQFDLVARQGKLSGHVKMVIKGGPHVTGHEGE
jgi:hypothetical protein